MARYCIGIDLGTTNSALAAIDLDSQEAGIQRIPQLVNAGEVGAEDLLPSFLYLPPAGELSGGKADLPWPGDAPIVGRLAQKRGAETQGRLVSSAKSWLSHAAVDRRGAVLPVSPAEGVTRVSPVAASQAYLAHLRSAWNHAHPEHPLEQQLVYLTVPASFDAAARDLTLEAAQQAGYGEVVLLEEPQAAFYAWLERHEDWRERVQVGDLILVVDIGGGTTDFTLIAVSEDRGDLRLERVAVGEHILLGGDNMDLALAHHVETSLAAKNVKLDLMQRLALAQQSRQAKEKLLAQLSTVEPANAGGGADEHPVTILGRGTGLIGGTIRAKLTRTEVEQTVLDGFFPACDSQDLPQRVRRAALQELGLPYATDAAITRHLAKFLRQPTQAQVGRTASGLAAPTHVLCNGGVLQAQAVRQRLLETLNQWLAAESVPAAKDLDGSDLMHAVARGAAYYGLARQGQGIRIRGGVARTYYVGIETAMPAVPGMQAPLKALTVVPFGMEEGSHASIPGRQFSLAVGEPAEFRFFSSHSRKADAAGDLLDEVPDDVQELAPIEVQLDASGSGYVSVSLEAVVTETGVLQLWCVAKDGRRWKLEFNVRERH